jgi:hypothetical protein
LWPLLLLLGDAKGELLAFKENDKPGECSEFLKKVDVFDRKRDGSIAD